MNKRMLFVVTIILMVSMVGCVPGPTPGQIAGGDSSRNVSLGDLEAFKKAAANWSVNLFRESFEGEENYLVSPISVLLALGITANGADNETLAEMEQAFGGKIEDINKNLISYLQLINSNSIYIANSI